MKLWSRVVLVVIVLSVFLQTSSNILHVKAQESNATVMSRTMIEFFRDDRTSIDVDRVARDELIVYGVFLSNFYKPWSTTLKDIVDDTEEDSIPKLIAKKFFGANGSAKSTDIVNINKKLYESITEVLGFDSQLFGLYSSSSSTTSVMTGEDLYSKIVGKDNDSYIYGHDGKQRLNVHDEATNATMKVLFGISPEYFSSKDKGLRSLKGLYMDGLGNIWGDRGNSLVEDYVLVLPSALNPVVFSGTVDDSKFPVANTFVMGTVLRIKQNFLKTPSFNVPYYNIQNLFPSDEYSQNNIVTMFGIHSPFSSFIGNTDRVLQHGYAGNPIDSVKPFLNLDSSAQFGMSEAKVILTVDPTKVPNIENLLSKDKSLTKEEKENLIEYLFSSTIFDMADLADNMYAFNVPLASSENIYDSSAGSFNDNASLIVEYKLFAREVGNGKYEFYPNSVLASPFLRLLDEYNRSEDKDTTLQSFLKNGSKVDTDTDHFKSLKEFLDVDIGLWQTDNGNIIEDAMLLIKRDEDLVYGLLEPAEMKRLKIGKWYSELIFNKPTLAGFGLTDGDISIAKMSGNARGESGLFPNNDGAVAKPPVQVSGSGGNIQGIGSNGSGTLFKSDRGWIEGADKRTLSTFYHVANSYNIFSINRAFSEGLKGIKSGIDKYETAWGEELTLGSTIMNEVNNFPGIYWGYMMQMLDVKLKDDGSGWDEIKSYSNPHLPHMHISVSGSRLDLNQALTSVGVDASEDKTLEQMTRDIVKKTYSLLTDGVSDYRDKLVKSTQNSWIISTHRDITSSNVANTLTVSAGGSNSYASVVGYINTPSLSELSLTKWFSDNYIYIYMFVMLIILICLVMMVLMNVRTVRQGILIFLLMAFVLLLPQLLVNNVVKISNAVGDSIYSDRFNYWAITQHQQSEQAGLSAEETGDELTRLIDQNNQMANNVYSTDSGVRLKWMSPKKNDVFDSLFSSTKTSQSLMSNLTIFRWLFNSFFNQEEYVHDDPLATYIYRPYNAIASDSKGVYSRLYNEAVEKNRILVDIHNKSQTLTGVPDYRFTKYIKEGYPEDIGFSEEEKISIEEVKPIAVRGGTPEQLESYRYWALNYAPITDVIFNPDMQNSEAGVQGDINNPYYMAFSTLTESPYYYFYNVFKHRYSVNGDDFKTSLLNPDIFKVYSSENMKINGEIRDFLDLEGLFTYVVPYLHQSNVYVNEWIKANGSSIDGYDFNEGIVPDKTENPELYEQYQLEKKRKEDLKNVWKLYSPWVDHIYETDVMNQRAKIADKTIHVADSLNPSAYEVWGRPMVFSPADMVAKSYRYSDLTEMERKIQLVLEETYTDLMYLTNYYDFSDEVLLTAAAMTATFNFNKVFSETNILGESIILYPQNFELRNFNFDAFMRLTLLNATGEPLMADRDLYVRVLDKTSIITGISLIIADVFGVVLIPLMKIVILLLLLFLGVILCISVAISPPDKVLKVVVKHIGLPSLLFLISSIIFAFVISLFMGEGLTGYVGGRTPELNVNDPTIMLCLMILVDCIYLYVLWKIVRLLFDSLKVYGTTSVAGIAGIVAGAGAGIVSSGFGRLRSMTSGLISSGTARRRHNQLIDTIKDSSKSGPSGLGSSNGDSKNIDDDKTYNRNNSTSSTNNSNRTNPDKPSKKDEDFKKYVDDLADKKKDNKASFGKKVVDVKRAVEKTTGTVREVSSVVRQGKDKAVETFDSIRDRELNVTDKINDLADKTYQKLAESVNKLADGVKEEVNEYRDEVNKYEYEQRKKDLESLKGRKIKTDATYERIEEQKRKLEEIEKKLGIETNKINPKDV